MALTSASLPSSRDGSAVPGGGLRLEAATRMGHDARTDGRKVDERTPSKGGRDDATFP